MKLIITESQYKTLLLNEEQERSNKSLTINDVLMGFSKLIGVNLSDKNKLDGDSQLDNSKVISKISDIFNNKEELTDMVKTLKETKGMLNINDKLRENVDEIIKKFNNLAHDKGLKCSLGADVRTNIKELK